MSSNTVCTRWVIHISNKIKQYAWNHHDWTKKILIFKRKVSFWSFWYCITVTPLLIEFEEYIVVEICIIVNHFSFFIIFQRCYKRVWWFDWPKSRGEVIFAVQEQGVVKHISNVSFTEKTRNNNIEVILSYIFFLK